MMRRSKRKSEEISADQKAQQDHESDEENFDSSEEYEVEAILRKQITKGKTKYLIKWKGYTKPTWAPAEDVFCQDLIDAFEKDNQGSTQSRAKASEPSKGKAKILYDSHPCVRCNEKGGASRKCHVCEQPMHHFCSHDVARSVGLEDFGDKTFCSARCYRAATSEPSVPSSEAFDSRISPINPIAEETSNEPEMSFTEQLQAAIEPLPTPRCIERPPTHHNTPAGLSEPICMNQLVAFCPKEEPWMDEKRFQHVGSAFITGRVSQHKRKKNSKKVAESFQVTWLDSQFQNYPVDMSFDSIIRGRSNYRRITESRCISTWKKLRTNFSRDSLPPMEDFADLEELEIDDVFDRDSSIDPFMQRYADAQSLPTTLSTAEDIVNMRFDPEEFLSAPSDLYKHEDGSTETRVKAQYRRVFESSASASFFAYLPISFWKQVLAETNANLATMDAISYDLTPFSLQELMTFLGILFYMAVIDKGEYSNYWGEQIETKIFHVDTFQLGKIMSLRRFKGLRAALSFCTYVSPDNLQSDPAARIRPLLNLLKTTASRYVDVGRNVSMDEASVACRSKYGRHMIVYNPTQLVGKYHFRIYTCCCATTWIAINYRLHGRGDIGTRLDGVVPPEEVRGLQEEFQDSSEIRKHVLEAVRPLYHSKRIVNTDNYYTSAKLLEALKIKGLYGRGTVRSTSQHFPKHVLLTSKDIPRGTYLQGVSKKHQMLAASWVDGNTVAILSNADPSTATNVQRRSGFTKNEIRAPMCVKEYNQHMQGVDRLDQIRARYSIANGHSFKKWHKNLAMAFIDIACCNAYLTRKLVCTDRSPSQDGDSRQVMATMPARNEHEKFMIELIQELVSSKWQENVEDDVLPYDDQEFGVLARSPTVSRSLPGTPKIPMTTCSTLIDCPYVTSKQALEDSSRTKRQCIVCRWEDRHPTESTNYCLAHKVCLCGKIYPGDMKEYMCPQSELTCWQKYHLFYLREGLFSTNGNLKRSSELYRKKAAQKPSSAVA